jgi:hypothetical protein
MDKIYKFGVNERVDIKSFSPVMARESARRDKRFVDFGIDNGFPQYCEDVINNCATLQSILKASVDYTFGSELIITPSNGLQNFNDKNESLEDTVKQCINDLWYHGGFAFQLKFGTLGNIVEILHTPFSIIRLSSDEKTAYLLEDLSNLKYVPKDVKSIRIFDRNEYVQNDIRMYYHKSEKLRIYPLPEFYSALSSIELLIKISKFRLSEIDNNFASSTLIKFKSNRVKDASFTESLQRDFRESFTGEGTAGRFAMIPLSEDEELTIDKLSPDNFDTRYKDIFEQAREDVFICFSAPPQIFGLPSPTCCAEQNYDESFNLYSRVRVKPKQDIIMRTFNNILGNNFLQIKPLIINTKEDSGDNSFKIIPLKQKNNDKQ